MYACSSSDDSGPDSTDTTGTETGTDAGTHTTGDSGSSTSGPQNPIQGVTTATAVSEFNGFYVDGLIWADGSLYVSTPYNPPTAIVKYTPGLDDPTTPYVPADGYALGITYDATQQKLLFANSPTIVDLTTDPKGTLERTPTGTATVTTVSTTPNPPPWWSPNDAVVAKDGTIYVTDPLYQVAEGDTTVINGVYSIATNGAVTLIDNFGGGEDSLVRPNGIGLSPKGDILYVSLTDKPSVVKYSIDASGKVNGQRNPFVQLELTAKPDGLGVDQDGNVYVATSTGVRVYKPDGSSWGTIATSGGAATNVAFGGSDFKTLYISTDATTGSGLFSAPVKVVGLQQ